MNGRNKNPIKRNNGSRAHTEGSQALFLFKKFAMHHANTQTRDSQRLSNFLTFEYFSLEQKRHYKKDEFPVVTFHNFKTLYLVTPSLKFSKKHPTHLEHNGSNCMLHLPISGFSFNTLNALFLPSL